MRGPGRSAHRQRPSRCRRACSPPGSWRGWRMRNMCWAGRCTGSSGRWPPTGFDVASGTLVGALKQIAPLVAPWAEAIAAHGRQAGHVHADETSELVPVL